MECVCPFGQKFMNPLYKGEQQLVCLCFYSVLLLYIIEKIEIHSLHKKLVFKEWPSFLPLLGMSTYYVLYYI